ncbi:polyubiquitin 8 [Ziziphus jujuba]|nr:polyubiquitin 8 [Ziziphus jujuba]
MVKTSETIKNLKDKVNWRFGIPENLQLLFFNGDILRNGQRLVDYGIHKDSNVLNLVINNFVGIKISIKLPWNPVTMVVEAKAEETVRHIKSIIKNKEGIKLEQFTLVYEGKLLEDDSRTLESLNIESEATFHVVLNPKDKLSIRIKMMPTKEIIKIQAKALFTVSDVKSVVWSIVGVSESDQNLIHDGKILEDDKTLAFYEIEDESVLVMF